MLALTDNAVQVIEGLLGSPSVPDGAGVKIQASPGGDAVGARLQITLAESPTQTDEVIADGSARVFVDCAVADLMDDKLLDAGIVGQEIHFTIGAQAP